MLEQIATVPQQPKGPCKNDRKTMLKKQALARYFFMFFIILGNFENKSSLLRINEISRKFSRKKSFQFG